MSQILKHVVRNNGEEIGVQIPGKQNSLHFIWRVSKYHLVFQTLPNPLLSILTAPLELTKSRK